MESKKRLPRSKIQKVTNEVGKIYKTNNYGDIEVIRYGGRYRVLIKFLSTGNVKEVQKHNIELGTIADVVGLVHGVGVREDGKYKTHKTKEYQLWASMLGRCYDPIQLNKSKTYRDCVVSDNFKNFQYFAEWCQQQIGFNMKGYQLDKDLLAGDLTGYSEDNCVFVPADINAFITKRAKRDLGAGISKRGNKFQVRVRVKAEASNKHFGNFDTHAEAQQVYKKIKESQAKELAVKYQGLVDDRVIEALNNYTVTIEG